MTKNKTPIREKKDLLDLLETQDLVSLREHLQLAPAVNPKKDDADLVEKVAGISSSSLLAAVIGIKSDTIQMLQDIFLFLTKKDGAVRTTGCFLSLNELVKIKPQQIGAVINWPSKPVLAGKEKTWEELELLFSSRIAHFLDELFTTGKPIGSEDDFLSRMMDPESHRDILVELALGRPPDTSSYKEVTYDKKAMELLEKLLEELTQLQGILKKAVPHVEHVFFTLLRTQINRKAGHLSEKLKNYKAAIKSADRRRESVSRIKLIYNKRQEEWLRFRESIIFSGQLIEAENLIELFRYDLFRYRPQLYEIWIMCTLLDSYIQSGCGLELCKTRWRGSALVWDLNYSRSATPVAKITNPITKLENFLFFQLFKGKVQHNRYPYP